MITGMNTRVPATSAHGPRASLTLRLIPPGMYSGRGHVVLERAFKVYRRAWMLIDNLNQCFSEPVVTAQHGGPRGGGASLTAFGTTLVEQYRAIEAEAQAVALAKLPVLEAALREPKGGAKKPAAG